MVRATPFVGLRPDPARTGPLCDVLARPGGVRGRPPRRHGAENLLGFVPEGAPSGERARRAAAHLRAWASDGTLRRDERPGIDVLQLEDTEGRASWGVVVLLDVHDPDLRPHEAVTATAADERRRLRATVDADLAPLLVMRRTPSPEPVAPARLAAGPALLEATDLVGVAHRLWHLDDPDVVDAVLAALADTPVLVADGHHRLAAATADAQQRPDTPAAAKVLAWVTEPDAGPRLSSSSRVRDVEHVWQVALRGDVLAPKSTRFEPKPRPGLVVRELSPPPPRHRTASASA